MWASGRRCPPATADFSGGRGGDEVDIRLKRAYDAPSLDDGVRVLVERLWPRGLSKERAAVDRWVKDLAPSTELRRWYAHDESKWPEFRRRYRAELSERPDQLAELRRLADAGAVTFIYGSRETERNSATVLRDVVEERPGRRRRTA
jgi:uncharacterized protein YeaO (DUF488 family)